MSMGRGKLYGTQNIVLGTPFPKSQSLAASFDRRDISPPSLYSFSAPPTFDQGKAGCPPSLPPPDLALRLTHIAKLSREFLTRHVDVVDVRGAERVRHVHSELFGRPEAGGSSQLRSALVLTAAAAVDCDLRGRKVDECEPPKAKSSPKVLG